MAPSWRARFNFGDDIYGNAAAEWMESPSHGVGSGGLEEGVEETGEKRERG